MADIQLSRSELEVGLPGFCLCCGAPATVWHEQRYELPAKKSSGGFSLLAQGLAVVDLLLGAPTRDLLHLGQSWFREQVKLTAPFCTAHQNHWRWRRWVILGGLAAALTLLFCAIVGSGWIGWEPAAAFFSGMGIFLVWCVAAAVAHETSIRVSEITEQRLTLKGVSPRFAAILDEYRR